MALYAWEYDDPGHPRPVEVRRLEAFLNTVDLHTFGEHAAKAADQRDLLSTPEGLQWWLATAGLTEETPEGKMAVGEDDLVVARRFRDGVRAWLLARQGDPHETDAIQAAQPVVDRMRLRVGLHDRRVALEPISRGATGALEQLVADLAVAQATGALARLKACSAPDCQFVYYDHSRSRTSRWCSMDTCGNRIKTRRYRDRQRV